MGYVSDLYSPSPKQIVFFKTTSVRERSRKKTQEPKALEMLDVVWYKNNLYVAGGGALDIRKTNIAGCETHHFDGV